MEFRANKRIKLSSQKGPSPLDLARTYCQYYVDPPCFEVKTVNDVIGEGVFATKPFKKGDFLLEYKGDLITRVKHARIDATNDIFHEGRMINDAENGDAKQNCVMKIVEVNQTPHLCTFADRDIAIGEELRYDYGVPTLPWRKVHSIVKMSSVMDLSLIFIKYHILN
ncbi:N-lysine methyltransferase KMT5A-A-like [Dreissena polymorpha]|uniref:N-lysine methyltransferase KMT5A-A-like n=1 Tax=Dreissena polymorpha TaxID=45954 RepID=UPI00226496BD|nr:N-lysine methyltransferase KMT5A-A-like [Dreissena polymorpha]